MKKCFYFSLEIIFLFLFLNNLSTGDIIFIKNISDRPCDIVFKTSQGTTVNKSTNNDRRWHQVELDQINQEIQLFFSYPTPFESQKHEETAKLYNSEIVLIDNQLLFQEDSSQSKVHWLTVINTTDGDIAYEISNAPKKHDL